MNHQFGEELGLALACAGLSGHRYDYDAIREVVAEQVTRIIELLELPIAAACVFVEQPENASDRYPVAVWIGTGDRILRIDQSTNERRSTTGFHVEILRPKEITTVNVTANRWFSKTPSSDSNLSIEFSAHDRRFCLTARMRNCDQLRKLLLILMEAGVVQGPDDDKTR
jgi:hypothetical protein